MSSSQPWDPLASMNKEIEEFEDFVDDFASKMNDILSGKVKDVEEIPPSSDKILPSKESVDSDLKKQPISDYVPPAAEEKSKPSSKTTKKGQIDYSKWEKIQEDVQEDVTPEPPKPKPQPAVKNPVVVKNPNHVQVVIDKVDNLKQRGNKSFGLKNYKEAILFYTEAIDTCLNPPSSLLSENTKSNDDPFAFLDRVLKPTPIPVSELLYMNRALCKVRLCDDLGGIEDYTRSLAINPNNLKASYGRAQAHRRLKNYQEALLDLEQCVSVYAIFPDSNKLIALDDLSSQCQQVKQLAQDQLNYDSLSKDNADVVQLIKSLLSDANTENTDKRFREEMLIGLFEQDSHYKHLFRQMNGMDYIVNSSPTLSWARLLVKCCKDVPENCRELAEKTSTLFPLLLNLDRSREESWKILDIALGFCLSEEIFLSKFTASNLFKFDRQDLFGNLLHDSLSSGMASKSFKSTCLKFILHVSKAGKVGELEKLWNYKLNDMYKRVSMEMAEYPYECISIFFHSTLDSNTAVKKELRGVGMSIIEKLIDWINRQENTSSPEVIDCVSIIFNILSLDPVNGKVPQTSWANLCRILVQTAFSNETSVKTLAKISRLVGQDVHEMLLAKLDWNHCFSVLGDSAQERLQGDWTQIIAVLLKSIPSSYYTFTLGFPQFSKMLNSCLRDPIGSSRVIGNSALCLIELASNDDIAQKLVRMGVVELVIYHLRAAKEQAVQKNLAICCAKLCKIPKGIVVALVRSSPKMNQIRQLDLAADAFFSLTFKKNKTSAEQKKLEKVKKQFGGSEYFWTLIRESPREEDLVLQKLCLVGALLFVDDCANDSTDASRGALLQALILFQEKFRISKENFSDFIIFLIDLRSLVLLEFMNDSGIKGAELGSFLMQPIPEKSLLNLSKAQKKEFQSKLAEQLDTINEAIEQKLEWREEDLYRDLKSDAIKVAGYILDGIGKKFSPRKTITKDESKFAPHVDDIKGTISSPWKSGNLDIENHDTQSEIPTLKPFVGLSPNHVEIDWREPGKMIDVDYDFGDEPILTGSKQSSPKKVTFDNPQPSAPKSRSVVPRVRMSESVIISAPLRRYAIETYRAINLGHNPLVSLTSYQRR